MWNLLKIPELISRLASCEWKIQELKLEMDRIRATYTKWLEDSNEQIRYLQERISKKADYLNKKESALNIQDAWKERQLKRILGRTSQNSFNTQESDGLRQ